MKVYGVDVMGRVFHAGFMTYLLITVIGYLVLCFVDPDTAHEVLINLHSLAVAVKV